MSFFSLPQWNYLRNVLIKICTVVVCPSLHGRYFPRPVSMWRIDRCGPFQCGRSVRIFRGHPPTLPHTVEEIDDKYKLNQKSDNGTDRDKCIEPIKISKCIKCIETIVPPWNTKHPQIMHRPENHVCRNDSPPEMHISQCFVHETTKHFGIPVIDTGKHSK